MTRRRFWLAVAVVFCSAGLRGMGPSPTLAEPEADSGSGLGADLTEKARSAAREANGTRSAETSHPNELWGRVLEGRVSGDGEVSYRELAGDSKGLSRVLAAMARASPETMKRDETVAFWINAHNAMAIHAVLDGVDPETPSGRLRLYRWHRLEIAGNRRTLEDVLEEIAPFGSADPRIYFALSNATRGGPMLSPEAYRADTLDAALARAVRRFVRDPERNRVDLPARRLELSRVFAWHRDAFERAGGSLAGYFSLYVDDPKVAAILLRPEVTTVFRDFDWALNAAADERPS